MTRHTNPEPVTDIDLMLLVDGELDPKRLEQTLRAVEADPSLKKKLAALSLTSQIIRDNTLEEFSKPNLADGIADAVMAKVATMPPPADAVSQLVRRRARHSEAAAANDNRRRWGWALAVAAGFLGFLWLNQNRSNELAKRPPQPITAPSALAIASASTPDAPDAPDADPSVEVSNVDFGEQRGSVFYISREAAESAKTTVIWVQENEDSAGSLNKKEKK